ncbi:alpha/beta hydrolase [Lapidilactobacillus achengensis]|uniref:Alpha/beta hydrolase n=1 Tax=Lapidilactobacillus achengensis TaxID=2486000 RepID=A0ABW1UNR4_9LACO|nr:alpha/beta hydrolase [Lapidilactobacillus achengensis]
MAFQKIRQWPKAVWHWLFLGLFLLLIVGLAWPSYSWTQANVKQMATRHNAKMSPVIMIPGSSANESRFDDLITTINKTDHQNHSLLRLHIYTDGTIKATGAIRPNDREPFIVVGFENNDDGYDNIKQQAKLFGQAFTQLTKKYNFNNFKGFGHSNGGLIYTDFLEHYFKDDQITMKRLMTVGTPYNFAENSTSRKTQMLADFIKDRSAIPENLVVYSVAGTENYDNDSIVPIKSVAAGKYIYQGQAAQYTQITVTGKMAQHSELLANPQIIELMTRYLLDPVKAPTKKTTTRTYHDADPTNSLENDANGQ